MKFIISYIRSDGSQSHKLATGSSTWGSFYNLKNIQHHALFHKFDTVALAEDAIETVRKQNPRRREQNLIVQRLPWLTEHTRIMKECLDALGDM